MAIGVGSGPQVPRTDQDACSCAHRKTAPRAVTWTSSSARAATASPCAGAVTRTLTAWMAVMRKPVALVVSPSYLAPRPSHHPSTPSHSPVFHLFFPIFNVHATDIS